MDNDKMTTARRRLSFLCMPMIVGVDGLTPGNPDHWVVGLF